MEKNNISNYRRTESELNSEKFDDLGQKDWPVNRACFPSSGHTGYGISKRMYGAFKIASSIAASVYSADRDTYKRQLEDWVSEYGEDCKVADAIANDAIAIMDSIFNKLEY